MYVATTDSGAIGLMWMNPERLTFRYIPGYKYPERGPARAVDNRASTWTGQLAAAFNGAFELKDGAGGYYYARTMVRPLRNGLASLVVDQDGHAQVVVWHTGSTVPAGTAVVRQNLKPLISEGVSRTRSNDSSRTWGLANGGVVAANRSALGQLADGSLLYAYGEAVTPAALAKAMVHAGARTAEALDMNKSWPMGFYYDASRTGHLPVGHKIQPGIWRSPSSYYQRFEKDFVVAETRA